MKQYAVGFYRLCGEIEEQNGLQVLRRTLIQCLPIQAETLGEAWGQIVEDEEFFYIDIVKVRRNMVDLILVTEANGGTQQNIPIDMNAN